ncbi:hypothetical protein GXP67_00800 [Rhodocytophaga rosea]|uniref:Uncharacterized protein n=1 Tax=Rhodocytophaga rosea TaxID=2704465 RepID=A0A6C0GBW1_9BACT|nr:hypothetical protein [Rhodocytophaga rosea]QHT65313.1 hypothetical protein GXP67_00800 [Rhodocytophaga rosea]
MKMESFFTGPTDEDTTVHLDLSLKTTKFIHSILVDCYDDSSYDKTSNELADIITQLEINIKNSSIENTAN